MKLNSKNNIELLARWVDEWQEQLFRYAFFRLGNRTDAEDVVQDAFLKIASITTPIANPKAYFSVSLQMAALILCATTRD